MEEKILTTRKLGMPMLLGNILLLFAIAALFVVALLNDNGFLLSFPFSCCVWRGFRFWA